MTDPGRIPFRDHLVELRRRIIYCLFVLCVFFVVFFHFSRQILDYFSLSLLPFLSSGTLVYSRLQDGFFLFFKTSLILALIVSSPFIMYQCFLFLAPGLYDNEKKWLKIFLFVGFLSFISGFLALYRFILPLFFSFFSRFVFDFYEIYPNVNDYIDFILRFNLYAGVLFLIPFFITTVTLLRIFPVQKFLELRRGFFVVAFIVAAALTPADIFSQIILACAIIFLYEVGIIAAYILTFFTKDRIIFSGR